MRDTATVPTEPVLPAPDPTPDALPAEPPPKPRFTHGGRRPGSGSKPGEVRSIKHGLFAISSLPKGAGWVRRIAGGMRTAIETAILEKYGELSLLHTALAQSAARHEARAQLAQRYLRLHSADMGHGERLSYMREIGNATDRRDACLRQLGLDRRADNLIDALYRTPEPPAEPDEPAGAVEPARRQTPPDAFPGSPGGTP